MSNSKKINDEAGSDEQPITSRRGFLAFLTGALALEAARALQGKMGPYAYKGPSKGPASNPSPSEAVAPVASGVACRTSYVYDRSGSVVMIMRGDGSIQHVTPT